MNHRSIVNLKEICTDKRDALDFRQASTSFGDCPVGKDIHTFYEGMPSPADVVYTRPEVTLSVGPSATLLRPVVVVSGSSSVISYSLTSELEPQSPLILKTLYTKAPIY